MPKVCINKKQYKQESIGGWIVSQCFTRKVKITTLADALDITRQAVYWKLHHNSFDYADLLTIFETLGCSDEEILQLMKL